MDAAGAYNGDKLSLNANTAIFIIYNAFITIS